MTPEEFAKQIRAHAQELRRAYADRWPRMMRKEAIEHFHEGFRNGGFTDTSLEKWDVTRRQSVPFNGATGQYTPLNSRTGDLMHSIDGRTEPGAVTVFSDSGHAKYHNEGAEATVTPRMRRFFWAMHAEAKKKHGKGNPETEFWKGMALTKKSRIRIPKRRFMGRSEALMKRIYNVILKDLKRLLNN